MLSSFACSHRLYLIIAVWILICGFAAIDLCDLHDELLQPLTVAGVGVESESEELDDDLSPLLRHEAEARGDRAASPPSQGWAVSSVPHEQRTVSPLYLQVSQFRI
ncbi:MAG: hypothetical protein LZF86_110591 [Nitrospira sp.]|nr:MAG: hypothetical protein LZF86_110591 [Nitrospira sp.]